MKRARGEEYNDQTTIPSTKEGKHTCKVAQAGLEAAIKLVGYLVAGKKAKRRI